MNTQGIQVYPLRGMDQRWRPDPTAALAIRDMRWNENDAWETSGGYREIVQNNPATGDNAFKSQGRIESLHWFSQHNGARQFLVWEDSNGRLRAFDGTGAPNTPWRNLEDVDGNAYDGTVLRRTVIATPWQKTQSQAWGGRLYLVNGYDVPLVFDGVKVERAGFDAPPPSPSASPLEITTTGFSDNTPDLGIGEQAPSAGGGYVGLRYRVSFLNERGQESPLSPPSGVAVWENSTTARGATMVNIPIGSGNVVARRVYRTRNFRDPDTGDFNLQTYGRIYYFLMEVPDNVTHVIHDVTPDSLLGAAVDPLDFGAWPPNVKYIRSFKNTMFFAGMTSNEVRFSAPNMPEVIPEDNVLEIGSADMGPITGMYPTKNALVVFKPRSIYLIKGDPSAGFYAETLNDDVGCSAPNTVRELPGIGLVFLSEDGVHVLQGALENSGPGTKVVRISTQIADEIKRINRSAIINAMGAIYHRDKEYWLAIPTLSSAVNNRVLIYHYEIGAWSFRDDFPINCLLESRDHRGYLLFGSHDSTNTGKQGIMVYSPGWATKGGTSLNTLYQSVNIDFGSVYRNVQPKYVNAYVITYGDNDIELNYTINRKATQIRSAAQSLDQQDSTDDLKVYGEAVWGTDKWYSLRPSVIRFDISTSHDGPTRELNTEFSPADFHLQIVGYDVEIAPGTLRNMKPVSAVLSPKGR